MSDINDKIKEAGFGQPSQPVEGVRTVSSMEEVKQPKPLTVGFSHPVFQYVRELYPKEKPIVLSQRLSEDPDLYERALQHMHKKHGSGTSYEEFRKGIHANAPDPFYKASGASSENIVEPQAKQTNPDYQYSWGGANQKGNIKLAGTDYGTTTAFAGTQTPETVDYIKKVQERRQGDYSTPADVIAKREGGEYVEQRNQRLSPMEKMSAGEGMRQEGQGTIAQYKFEMETLSNDVVELQQAITQYDSRIKMKLGPDAFDRNKENVQQISQLEKTMSEFGEIKTQEQANEYNKLVEQYNDLFQEIDKFQKDPQIQERDKMVDAMNASYKKAQELLKQDQYKSVAEMADLWDNVQKYDEDKAEELPPLARADYFADGLILKSVAKLPAALGALMDIGENIVTEDKKYTRWDKIEDYLRDLETDANNVFPTPSKWSRPMSTKTAIWESAGQKMQVDFDKNGDIQSIRDMSGRAVGAMLSEDQKDEIKNLPKSEQLNLKGIPYKMGELMMDMLWQIGGSYGIEKATLSGFKAINPALASATKVQKFSDRLGTTMSVMGSMSNQLYNEGLEAFKGDKEKAAKFALTTGTLIGFSANLFGLESKLKGGSGGILDEMLKSKTAKSAIGQGKTPAAVAGIFLKGGAGEMIEETILEDAINRSVRYVMGAPRKDFDPREMLETAVLSFAAGSIGTSLNVGSELNDLQVSSLLAAARSPDGFEKAIRSGIENGTVMVPIDPAKDASEQTDEWVIDKISMVRDLAVKIEIAEEAAPGADLTEVANLVLHRDDIQKKLEKAKAANMEPAVNKYQAQLDGIDARINFIINAPAEQDTQVEAEQDVTAEPAAGTTDVQPAPDETVGEQATEPAAPAAPVTKVAVNTEIQQVSKQASQEVDTRDVSEVIGLRGRKGSRTGRIVYDQETATYYLEDRSGVQYELGKQGSVNDLGLIVKPDREINFKGPDDIDVKGEYEGHYSLKSINEDQDGNYVSATLINNETGEERTVRDKVFAAKIFAAQNEITDENVDQINESLDQQIEQPIDEVKAVDDILDKNMTERADHFFNDPEVEARMVAGEFQTLEEYAAADDSLVFEEDLLEAMIFVDESIRQIEELGISGDYVDSVLDQLYNLKSALTNEEVSRPPKAPRRQEQISPTKTRAEATTEKGAAKKPERSVVKSGSNAKPVSSTAAPVTLSQRRQEAPSTMSEKTASFFSSFGDIIDPALAKTQQDLSVNPTSDELLAARNEMISIDDDAVKAAATRLPTSAPEFVTDVIPKDLEIEKDQNRHKGAFGLHIEASIPTFKDSQVKKARALSEVIPAGGLMYDLGGSEGSLVKSIAANSSSNAEFINLDASNSMKEKFDKTPVDNTSFVPEAFGEGFKDGDTEYVAHKPKKKADVVHESMLFQFISPNREEHIDEITNSYLKDDGLLIVEEKVFNENWEANEQKKNQDWKPKYFSDEDIALKEQQIGVTGEKIVESVDATGKVVQSPEVITGMNSGVISDNELRNILEDRFEFVEQYWDGGNFKGYVATNSKEKIDAFMKAMGGPIISEYSNTKPTTGQPPATEAPTTGQPPADPIAQKIQEANNLASSYEEGSVQHAATIISSLEASKKEMEENEADKGQVAEIETEINRQKAIRDQKLLESQAEYVTDVQQMGPGVAFVKAARNLLVGRINFKISSKPIKATKAMFERFLRETFTSKGKLNKAVYWIDIKRVANINSIMKKAAMTKRRFTTAINTHYGKMTPELMEALDGAIKDPNLMAGGIVFDHQGNKIPAEVRTVLREMRGHVKALSTELVALGVVTGDLAIKILDDADTYLTRSYQVHSDADWLNKVDNTAVFNRAVVFIRGLYQQRIQAKTDEQTFERQRIANWQQELLTAPTARATELTRMIRNANNRIAEIEKRILSDIERYQNNNQELESEVRSMIKEQQKMMNLGPARRGQLGTMDFGILKARKDIPKEVRELFGEYKDPIMNYTMSIYKQIHLLENHKFLNEVKRQGYGKWLFDNTVGEFDEEITGLESSALEPLNGLYTNPMLAEAFREYNKPGSDIPKWLAAAAWLSSKAKYAKTIMSPVAQTRNFVFNTFLMWANGHLAVPFASKEWKDAWRDAAQQVDAIDALSRKKGKPVTVAGKKIEFIRQAWRNWIFQGDLSTQDREARIQEYVEKGVLGESVTYEEVIRTMDEVADAWGNRDAGISDFLANNDSSFLSFLEQMYEFGDNFWRIYMYKLEQKRYARKLFNKKPEYLRPNELEQVKDASAMHVRDHLPTYSSIPKNIQRLRAIPLTGTFVSWPYESVRVFKNGLTSVVKAHDRYAQTKDKNDLKEMGARLAGIMATTVGMAALSRAAHSLVGFSDEDEDKLRYALPEWSEENMIIPLTRNIERGDFSYIDIGMVVPQAFVINTVSTLVDERLTATQRISRATKELLDPFLGQDMMLRRAMLVARNEKESGATIAPKDADFILKLREKSLYSWEVLEPGILTTTRRVTKSIFNPELDYHGKLEFWKEALAIFPGIRVSTSNFHDAFNFAAKDWKERTSAAKRMVSPEYGKEQKYAKLSPEDAAVELERIKKPARKAYRKVMTEASRVYHDAVDVGANPQLLQETLKDRSFNKDEIEMIISGVILDPVFRDEKPIKSGKKKRRR